MDLWTSGYIDKRSKLYCRSVGAFDRILTELRSFGLIDLEVCNDLQAPIVQLEDFDPFQNTRAALIFRPCSVDRQTILRSTAPIVQAFGEQSNDVLFIQRAGNNPKRVFDMGTISRTIKAQGFVVDVSELEQATLRQQTSLFSGAKVIVAQHGAALGNLVWSPPGVSVVEICPGNMLGTPYFEILARILGLDYTRILQNGPLETVKNDISRVILEKLDRIQDRSYKEPSHSTPH